MTFQVFSLASPEAHEEKENSLNSKICEFMEAKALSETGPLRHFTMRDVFYLAGCLCTLAFTYANVRTQIGQIEKDTTRDITELKITTAQLSKDMIQMDHNGTTASKNGIYQESKVSENNLARLVKVEDAMNDGKVKTAEIIVTLKQVDSNVNKLMEERGLGSKKP